MGFTANEVWGTTPPGVQIPPSPRQAPSLTGAFCVFTSQLGATRPAPAPAAAPRRPRPGAARGRPPSAVQRLSTRSSISITLWPRHPQPGRPPVPAPPPAGPRRRPAGRRCCRRGRRWDRRGPAQLTQVGHPADLGDARAPASPTSCGLPARGNADDRGGRPAPLQPGSGVPVPHSRSTCTQACSMPGSTGRSGGTGGEEFAQRAAPAQVRQPRQRPAVGDRFVGLDLALDRHAQPVHARWATAAAAPGRRRRGSGSAPAAAVAAAAMSAGNQRPAQLSQRPQARAVSSSSDRGDVFHPAAGRVLVDRPSSPAHRPGPRRSGRTARRRSPRAGRWTASRRRRVRTAPSTASTFSSSSSGVRRRSTRASSATVDTGRAGLGQRRQHGRGLLLRRHGRGGEVLPDVRVLRPGQQQHIGVGRATAGAAHLLVVRHRGRRRAQVDDEAQVRLVEAHARARWWPRAP